ncbi:hypothetical protein [Erythrobacter sp. SD-21]|uniref:hypothetical protein n=1 Tax=Erythrobacter sp. SD-21 TaxID=161528 RepID=UPI0012EA1C4F|nr:hypothetical protein [Erythrobacter sp. SD-21]
MRIWVVSYAALALAGCGSSNSTDLTLDGSGDASLMEQNLAMMRNQTTERDYSAGDAGWGSDASGETDNGN